MAVLLIVGCGNVDVVGHVGGGGSSGGTGGASGGATTICGGSAAERTFRFALCVCGQAQVGNLHTDVVDATTGATRRGGAAVGINAALSPNASPNVSGSLLVNGDLTLPAMSQVDGDLKVAGGLDGGDQSHVLRDAWVDGNVSLPWNGVSVNRDVYAPASQAPHGIQVGGTFHERSFSMTGPCDCGSSAIVDVGAVVAGGAQSNDNASVALDSSRFVNVANSEELTLPAGRFYLESMAGSGSATIHVSDKTMLIVGGNLEIGQLTVDVGSTGEIDLFVGGSLRTSNLILGTTQRPAASRVYVAGAQSITFNEFIGNLYAPNAQITSTGTPAIVHGSLFVGSLVTGDLSIHFDESIGSAGAACGNPTTCRRSQDCVSGSACVGGTCSACATDSDCSAPLICDTSRCSPLHP
jgi:hypothetical protein